VLAKAIVALGWGVERPIRTVVVDVDKEDVVEEGVEEGDERFVDLLDICDDERIKQASMVLDGVGQ